MRENQLHTVCEEAHCPNVGECWEHGTATFMILGDVCTRNCAYCAVAHGRPPKYDPTEPERVAAAAAEMKLQARRHHVGRSRRPSRLRRVGIRRDHPPGPHRGPGMLDRSARPRLPGQRGLDPGGARRAAPRSTTTTPRRCRASTRRRRPGGRYERVMNIFRFAKRVAPGIPTKTGIIVGMGETNEEVLETMRDLRAVDVDILTIGQYLRPSSDHIALDRYVTPEEFRMFSDVGLRDGLPPRRVGAPRPFELPRVGAGPGGEPPVMAKHDTKSRARPKGGAGAEGVHGPAFLRTMLLQRHFEERVRRGLRARQDRRLLPPVHRPGGRLDGRDERAPRRRLRDHDVPRSRAGARARRDAARRDGRVVRPRRWLLARQGRIDAPLRPQRELPRRARHRRRPRSARDRRRRSRSSTAAATR